MLLFYLLFSTGVCGLEAMLNPVYMDNVVGTKSESESENALLGISGQLPSVLAAQIPTVAVEKYSDIHIGPHLQHNGPVTVEHFITVNGKDNFGYLPETPSKNTDSTTPQPPVDTNAVGMYSRVIQIFA
jgi:hypothetical protein